MNRANIIVEVKQYRKKLKDEHVQAVEEMFTYMDSISSYLGHPYYLMKPGNEGGDKYDSLCINFDFIHCILEFKPVTPKINIGKGPGNIVAFQFLPSKK